MKTKTKVYTALIGGLVLIIGAWFAWNYVIPSEDIQLTMKDMKADAAGLNRVITHTLYDGTSKSWEVKTKVYPFPSDGGAGASFSFIDSNGKKIICGPGWRIEEK